MPTGYGFVLPDQNGWSRHLHFQAAWALVLTGLLYAIFGLVSGHLRRNLLPGKAELSWRVLSDRNRKPFAISRPSESEAWSYNVLQRLTYLFVIFVLFPLVIWTGLAMSPGIRFRGSGVVTVWAASSPRARFISSFRRSGAVPAGPRRDGLSRGIQESDASDDHGSRGT